MSQPPMETKGAPLQPSPEPPPSEDQAAAGINRRLYERSFVPVTGRLMLPSGTEHACQVVDISEGGIALQCPAETKFRDRIIVYLDDLGRFEGEIIRFLANGFAIETQLGANQRERLVERVEWLKQAKTGADRRTLPRRIPAHSELDGMASMTVEPGTQTPCTVLDISVTGAHLQTSNRPKLGTHVTIGRMLARVMRHTARGIGVEFVTAGVKDSTT